MILAQNVCLGFEARGLGICYKGTTLNSLPEISGLFNLPETCVPVTTFVVGYPEESHAARDRLPLDAYIHDEVYRCPEAAAIDAYFKYREATGWERYTANPRLRELAEGANITSLAQFYTSQFKYDPDDFAELSGRIHSFLETKGFLP